MRYASKKNNPFDKFMDKFTPHVVVVAPSFIQMKSFRISKPFIQACIVSFQLTTL
jgi:hypothetical protein